jgi:hypothetical protein
VPSIVFNIVLTRQNAVDLPGYVDFVGRLPRNARTYFAIMPSVVFMAADNGNWDEVAVSHTDLVPGLVEATRRAARIAPGLMMAMEGECAIPPCITHLHPELQALAPTERLVSDVEYLDDPDRRRTGYARVKRLTCRTCRYDARCDGVSSLYARTFGLGELTPRA